MSWCRWGSHCASTFSSLGAANCPTPDVDCPGSSLYIYEGAIDGKITCCSCPIMPLPHDEWGAFQDFATSSYKEMLAHVEAHVAKGAHVRLSILAALRAHVADGDVYDPDVGDA